MEPTKVITHQPIIVDDSGQANLPPYTSGPHSQPPGSYPQPQRPPGQTGPSFVQTTVVSPGGFPVMVGQQQMGTKPTSITCKSCNNEIVTKVESKATMCTHLGAIMLCGLCCCCLPYLMKCCMNTEHYCPNCGAFIGSHVSS